MRRLLPLVFTLALLPVAACTPEEVQLWFKVYRNEEISWDQAVAIAEVTNRPKCDPNYEGACVPPNVPDVDCAGGSGNGPYYVQGPVRVVGTDIHGLDRDRDGIGCERG